MRVAINAIDNVVTIDGWPHNCDCKALLGDEISAVQWYGDHGEIEFVGHKRPNARFDDFSEFQEFVDQAEPWPKPKTAEELEAEVIDRREADPVTRLGHRHPSPKFFTVDPSQASE